MNKKVFFFGLVVLYIQSLHFIFVYAQNSPPVAVTAGKSFFRTKKREIYLETAFNRRPTMSQANNILVSDIMIFDEEKEIGYAYGNLRFADLINRTFLSSQEGTYYSKEKKIVLRKDPQILIEQSEYLATKIIGNVITIYPETSYLIVQGNLKIDDGETVITGKQARIWLKEDKMVITGDVLTRTGDQKLTTDRLNVFFKRGGLDHYTAVGNVKAVNTADHITLCSGLLTYTETNKFFRATKDPSIYFQDSTTISFANVIEYDQSNQTGNLLGDIVTVQGTNQNNTQRAYSRWALYDGKANTINMFGNPRLVQDGSELYGTEIIVNIDSNNMEIKGGSRGFLNNNF